MDWKYISTRLREPSTWASVCVLAGYFGYKLDADLLMGAAVAVLTLVGIFVKKDSQSQ